MRVGGRLLAGFLIKSNLQPLFGATARTTPVADVNFVSTCTLTFFAVTLERRIASDSLLPDGIFCVPLPKIEGADEDDESETLELLDVKSADELDPDENDEDVLCELLLDVAELELDTLEEEELNEDELEDTLEDDELCEEDVDDDDDEDDVELELVEDELMDDELDDVLLDEELLDDELLDDELLSCAEPRSIALIA
jgi:hypothetical protein